MGSLSKLACTVLEGVLVPELWPAITVRTGIREFADPNPKRLSLRTPNGSRILDQGRAVTESSHE